MRVLDCKAESCQAGVEGAPRMTDHLCPDCDSHFAAVKMFLTRLSIPFNLNSRLVRGLDYYTRTAFEIVAGGAGAQASLSVAAVTITW